MVSAQVLMTMLLSLCRLHQTGICAGRVVFAMDIAAFVGVDPAGIAADIRPLSLASVALLF
jgi:hypothetical protein